MPMKLRVVAVGGTFDEFHKGHETLLLKAFEAGRRVKIGLCSENLVKRLNKPHVTAPYDQRLKELTAFLLRNGLLERAEISSIDDPFGVTLTDRSLEGIVVSRETESTALLINRKRRELGLPPLAIVVINMVPSNNHIPVSTTRIRCGEIDREGHVLRKRVTQKRIKPA
jgi:pantetheine-phosphate adenylyltransferase